MGNIRKVATLLLATLAIAVGAVAPAFADNSRAGTMTHWGNGQKSWKWKDASAGSPTRVTFAKGCTREFTATIRLHVPRRPDPKPGSEHINCRSYQDAVRAKNGAKGTYHFDISALGYVCYSGACHSYVTSGKFRVFW